MTNISKTWTTGETITADSLNKISPHFIEGVFDYDNSTLSTDETAGDIFELMAGGNFCVIYTIDDNSIFYYYPLAIDYNISTGLYSLTVFGYSGQDTSLLNFSASSADAPFVFNFGGGGGGGGGDS